MSKDKFRVTLEAARVNRSMTQEDVAAAIGVSRYSVINWETGKTAIPFKRLAELSELYDTPINRFFVPAYSILNGMEGDE